MLSKRKKPLRPYKVTEAFNLTRRGKNELRFDHGSYGAAFDYDEKSKCYLVSIPDPDPGETDKVAWVPAKYVRVNHEAEVGQISVDFGRLGTTVKPFNDLLHGQRLFRVMMEFFEALRRAPGLDTYMLSPLMKISSEKLQTICRRIVDGFWAAGVDQVLERGHFTLESIRTVARIVPLMGSSTGDTKKDPTKGIYLIVHTTRGGTRAIYVGKSVNIILRAAKHKEASTSGTSPHYQTWRKSIVHEMYVLCRLDHLNNQELAETIDFAELFLITIGLQTYPTWLLETTPEAVQEGNEFDTVLGEPTDDDDAAAVPDMDALHAVQPQHPDVVKAQPNTEVRHTTFKEIALKVMTVAKIVAERTHWPGGTARENFGCERGLNIATPLSVADGGPHNRTPTVWQQMEIPKVMTLYVRSAQRVVKIVRNESGIILIYSKEKSIKCLITESAPKLGTTVYVMFEVMHSGAHPYEFARLPDLAEANDWALARALGIAYLWCDESGNWHKRYVQSALWSQYTEADVPCKSYCEAISIVRALRQEVIRDHPEWIGSFRPFLIHRINLDWMSQCYRVSTAMNITQVPMPMSITRAARINVLTSAGAENIGKPFPYLNGLPRRTKCDACYLTGRLEKCEQVPGTQSCFYCNKLRGIACSWTPKDRMSAKLIALLVPKAKKDASILTSDVPDPKFMQITTSGVAGLSLS